MAQLPGGVERVDLGDREHHLGLLLVDNQDIASAEQASVEGRVGNEVPDYSRRPALCQDPGKWFGR